MLKLIKKYALEAIAIGFLLSGAILLSIPVSAKLAAASSEAPTAVAQENVFMVTSEDGSMSGGTGFLIATIDYGKVIVTNRHVCETFSIAAKRAILRQGARFWHVDIRAKSDLTDLCVIYPPVEVIDNARGFRLAERDARPGDDVSVEGHPFLRPLTKYSGHYVNTTPQPQDILDIDPTKWIRVGRLDFMVFPGNSGSPLLNKNSEVIGVIFAMEGGSRNGLYIPLLDLKYFLMQTGASR